MLPYGTQSITDEDIAAAVSVLKGDYLTQGPTVEKFEAQLAEYLRSPYAVSCSNGTAALHMTALALDIKAGDAVFVPAITFAATSNAILYTGGTPIFVDIENKTYGMCPRSLEKAYALALKHKLKPKAIFVVHYAGMPSDMTAIAQFAQEHELRIVEDACHALGAEYRLDSTKQFCRVGSSLIADMSCFSFHPVKHITTGEGGAVTTANPLLAEKLKLLRSHGITKNSNIYIQKERAYSHTGEPNAWYHEMQILGYNYRLCDIQAALGITQLSKLDDFVRRRREIASYYNKAFANQNSITPPPHDNDYAKHSYHLYPLRIDFKKINKTRAQVVKEMHLRGIGSQVHYVPVFTHPYYQHNKERWLSEESCPEAQLFYEQELSIPMYPKLTDDNLTFISETIISVCSSP